MLDGPDELIADELALIDCAAVDINRKKFVWFVAVNDLVECLFDLTHVEIIAKRLCFVKYYDTLILFTHARKNYFVTMWRSGFVGYLDCIAAKSVALSTCVRLPILNTTVAIRVEPSLA